MQQRINLNLRVAQKQVLTPGLVQMVSVLALNKLELRDMITSELVENPVLEEVADGDAETDAETLSNIEQEVAADSRQSSMPPTAKSPRRIRKSRVPTTNTTASRIIWMARSRIAPRTRAPASRWISPWKPRRLRKKTPSTKSRLRQLL